MKKTILLALLLTWNFAALQAETCNNEALEKAEECKPGIKDCPEETPLGSEESEDECSKASGSPIDLRGGNLIRMSVDLKEEGGVGEFKIELNRFYRSRYIWWGRWTKMGQAGWRHSFDHNLYLQRGGNAFFYCDSQGDGFQYFRKGTTNEFRASNATPDVLWQWSSDGNRFTLVKPDQTELDFVRSPTPEAPQQIPPRKNPRPPRQRNEADLFGE